MTDTKGCFSATMSFHTMLRRAQELSPVLTYVLCKLLISSEVKKDEVFVCSPRVANERRHDKLGFSYYFMGRSEMHSFVETIFHNITVRISGPSERVGDGYSSFELTAHREFVLWLQKLYAEKRLSVNDEERSVTIPA